MIKFRNIVLALALATGIPASAAFAEETPAPAKVLVHVDNNDQKVLTLALNNVLNLLKYYKKNGTKVQVEILANGPGVHLLREDTSPAKERVMKMAAENPQIQFSACANTVAAMTKKAGGKKPPLLKVAKIVPSGVVRIVELEKQGYTYIKP